MFCDVMFAGLTSMIVGVHGLCAGETAPVDAGDRPGREST